MAQQTAVKWLENKFQKFLSYYEGNHKAEPYTIEELSNDFEQAKKMFEEQIIDAHLTGLIRPLEIEATKQAQHYYNETYGNNQNK